MVTERALKLREQGTLNHPPNYRLLKPERSIPTADNLTGYLDNTSYYILLDLSLTLNA